MSELLDIKDIATLYRVSLSHARQHIVTADGFPPARLVPGRGEKRGLKRWRKTEVLEHIEQLPVEK